MSDLKRVGLVFNEEGSAKFVKSIKEVNSELRENYQQFKITQSQWDQSTKTSQKLQDRLYYLNNAYDTQKDKLRVLNIELEELESNESASSEQIARKKAQVKQAEAELNRYEKRIEGTNKRIKEGTADLEDFAKSLDKQGKTLQDVGKKMSVYSGAYAAASGLAVKSAIDFESALAGVSKTVNPTQEELAMLSRGIRDMALEIPATTTELAEVAEMAGQLGIKTDNILDFTETITALGVSTNMSLEQASTQFARFANIVGMSQNDFDRLGSVIVALGNNFATTESEIMDLGMRLAAQSNIIGLTESETMALATTMSSLGLSAEAGGTAMSTVLKKIQVAVDEGGATLEGFAEISGLSAEEFSKAFREKPIDAIDSFIKGLDRTNAEGGNLTSTLKDLGISGIRETDTLLRMAGASDLLSEAVNMSTDAWLENNALTEEAEQFYDTTESQMATLKNTLNELAISFGELLLPAVNNLVESLKDVLNWINNLSPATKNIILVMGGLLAAVGPLLIIFGTLARNLSSLIMFFSGSVVPAFGTLSGAISGLLVPVALVIAVITAFGLAIKQLWNTNENFRNALIEAWDGIKDTLKNVWETVLEPIFESLKETLMSIWTDSLKPLWDRFVDFTEQIILLVIEIWNGIKPFVNWFVDTFGSVLVALITFFASAFKSAFNIITDVFETALSSFTSIISGIKNIFSGLIDFITGIFTGDWKRAWEGIKSIFKGVFESLWGIVKAPLNLIITGINGLIGGINAFIRGVNKIKIPKWVPGIGGNGLNLPELGRIKLLATGGDLLKGAAIVGEQGPELAIQNSGRTSVVPLTETGRHNATSIIDYDRLGESVARAMRSMKFSLDEDGFGKFVDDKMLEVIT